jgi:NAD(P)-dependent dehydrogenase (short-subunit alcohol dehydrogenase family)
MKTIIITGSSGNLGRAVVKKFLNEGYKVIGTDMRMHEENVHEHFEHFAVDLTNEADAENFINDIINKYQSIDAAVLTAGGFAMGKVGETKMEDIKKQFSLNFETAYNVSRPVFQQMMQQGSGRIFMIGSKPGSDMKYSKGMVAYGLTKSLIFRLAELMNDEAKGTNVVATVIVPSTIDTPENRKAMPDVDSSKWVKPENIAAIIYFYCSEAASVIREPVIKSYNNA